MKKGLVALLIVTLAASASAIERKSRASYSPSDLWFYQNLALTLEVGAGIPMGGFSNSSLGNAETGVLANFQVEYYFSPNFSAGFDFSGGVFDDEDDIDLSSWVHDYQLALRFLVPVEGRVRPYAKLGLGVSNITYRVESPVGTLTSTSDLGMSLGLGGGVLWRVSRHVSLNTGVGYRVAFLDDAEVENSGLIVGYDPSYFAFNFGLSFFIKP